MSGKIVISKFEDAIWVILCSSLCAEANRVTQQIKDQLSNMRVVVLHLTDPDMTVEFQEYAKDD